MICLKVPYRKSTGGTEENKNLSVNCCLSQDSNLIPPGYNEPHSPCELISSVNLRYQLAWGYKENLRKYVIIANVLIKIQTSYLLVSPVQMSTYPLI
jgi:hypothetical protein